MCILYNVTGCNTQPVITSQPAGIRQNRKLKSEYQNRKAKKYVFGFLFHPFIDKNSEKTIKYRFFRGRQSEKRSFSVP